MSEDVAHHTSRITGNSVVCIIGLGYVGLPLLEAFSRKLKVIGFDIKFVYSYGMR